MATVEPRPRSAPPTVDVSRARANRTELERLFVEHGGRVYTICGSILGNRQEAEDAAQQVFVSALRALQTGTVPRDAGAWLATIARHESWARSRRQPPVPLHVELPDLAQEDPAATVVRRAELTEAWRTIAELPRAQREALLLREVRGLGYDEVAADLRLSHASVRSLLSRARRTLRMQLEKDAGALTGAQWLNLLTRLFGDTSNPALSSATRTAAVGLGTLAITGGAIVAPPLARHPHQPAVTRVTRPAANVQTAARRSVVIAAIAVRPSAVTGEHSDLGRGGRNGRHDSAVAAGLEDRRERGGRSSGRSSRDLPNGVSGSTGSHSDGDRAGVTSNSGGETSGGSSGDSSGSSGSSGPGGSAGGPTTVTTSAASGGGGTSSGSSSGSPSFEGSAESDGSGRFGSDGSGGSDGGGS